MLAEHFLAKFRRETNKPVEGFDAGALELLCAYDWPGNVRELENAVERAVVLTKGRRLQRDDLPFSFGGRSQRAPFPQGDGAASYPAVLSLCGGNISRAAKLLEINRTTLHNKIKKYGLRVNG